jgi:hypothetical protein
MRGGRGAGGARSRPAHGADDRAALSPKSSNDPAHELDDEGQSPEGYDGEDRCEEGDPDALGGRDGPGPRIQTDERRKDPDPKRCERHGGPPRPHARTHRGTPKRRQFRGSPARRTRAGIAEAPAVVDRTTPATRVRGLAFKEFTVTVRAPGVARTRCDVDRRLIGHWAVGIALPLARMSPSIAAPRSSGEPSQQGTLASRSISSGNSAR